MADLRCGDVERAELHLELLWVVDHRRQVAEGDELAVVEQAADESGVAVASLLAVGDDVHARAKLGADAEPRRVIRRGLKLRVIEPALEPVVHRLVHPARAGPAADTHDRQRRDLRSRSRRGQRFGYPDLYAKLFAYRPGGRNRHPSALGERTLADEEATPAGGLRPRDQLVAGQPAPGGQLDLDR